MAGFSFLYLPAATIPVCSVNLGSAGIGSRTNYCRFHIRYVLLRVVV
jgi:hypothetical protein